jgi:hypothetical protein
VVDQAVAYRVDSGLLIRLESEKGTRFLQISGNHAELLSHEPSLEDADEIDFKEAPTSGRMPSTKSMRPMKPLKPIAPMELKMGSMRMSMGGSEEKRGN